MSQVNPSRVKEGAGEYCTYHRLRMSRAAIMGREIYVRSLDQSTVELTITFINI